MVRRGVVTAITAVLLWAAPAAHAASSGRVVVTRCDRDDHAVVFEGRMTGSGRLQMRFTLQAQTPDEPGWRKVDAEGFGVWITAPAGVRRYLYDKTVENLIAPASYRAVVNFRWRNARGRIVRRSRATSGACRQPDPRPDLVVRQLRIDPAAVPDRRRYVAVIANTGRGDAGAFDVDFTRAGALLGTASADGLAAGETTTVVVTGPACAAGELVGVDVDARGAVDEADEDDDTATLVC